MPPDVLEGLRTLPIYVDLGENANRRSVVVQSTTGVITAGVGAEGGGQYDGYYFDDDLLQGLTVSVFDNGRPFTIAVGTPTNREGYGLIVLPSEDGTWQAYYANETDYHALLEGLGSPGIEGREGPEVTLLSAEG